MRSPSKYAISRNALRHMSQEQLLSMFNGMLYGVADEGGRQYLLLVSGTMEELNNVEDLLIRNGIINFESNEEGLTHGSRFGE